jgi:hypothetical protein
VYVDAFDGTVTDHNPAFNDWLLFSLA